MPEPLYVSKDRKRVGTIASMRAYEAGNDPLESSLEAAILTAVTEETPLDAIGAGSLARQADAEMKARRECPGCAEHRPLINAVQKAVVAAYNPLTPMASMNLAWGQVMMEFTSIYGDPE